MASHIPGPQLRSLYRRLLRELPTRQPSNLANPSPIQHRIRSEFSSEASTTPTAVNIKASLQATDQFIQYIRAQRMYTTLIERYNPGMNMTEESRVKLTARRVGMNLPVDFIPGVGDKGGSGQR